MNIVYASFLFLLYVYLVRLCVSFAGLAFKFFFYRVVCLLSFGGLHRKNYQTLVSIRPKTVIKMQNCSLSVAWAISHRCISVPNIKQIRLRFIEEKNFCKEQWLFVSKMADFYICVSCATKTLVDSSRYIQNRNKPKTCTAHFETILIYVFVQNRFIEPI